MWQPNYRTTTLNWVDPHAGDEVYEGVLFEAVFNRGGSKLIVDVGQGGSKIYVEYENLWEGKILLANYRHKSWNSWEEGIENAKLAAEAILSEFQVQA